MKEYRIKVGNRWHKVQVDDIKGEKVHIILDGSTYDLEIQELKKAKRTPSSIENTDIHFETNNEDSGHSILAPFHARVASILVKKGQRIKAGAEVCILEAMKMEQSIRSTISGKIKKIHIKAGRTVKKDEILIEIE